MENIFNLIKKRDIKKIIDIIENEEIIDLDIHDENYNYFIHYVVNNNDIELLNIILEKSKNNKINIRFDILDIDGRTILYNSIKFNYIEIIKILLEYNKMNIGISIFDIKDRLGYTSLHYSVIFNNFDAFKLLLDNNADPYIFAKDGNNIFMLALTFKRNNMILYLINNNYNLNFKNNSGETFIQIALNYQNIEIVEELLKTNINLNNTNYDYGFNILHQSIILGNFNIYEKLLNKEIDYNIPDFFGNTPLHYIFIENKISYLELLLEKNNIKFNISNINGETPLHIMLDLNINDINENLIKKMITNTDLNIQDNKGQTCFMKIINNNLIDNFKDLLVLKPLNIFIEDNEFNSIKLTDSILEILVNSYYNQIKDNKNNLLLNWEIWCSKDDYNKLKTIIKSKDNNIEDLCKKKIKETIINEKRSLPKMQDINIIFDNGILLDNCFYTGSLIDILFGLILLQNEFKNNGLYLVLDYPLTINQSLENNYKKMGINYPFKLDFSNIEIVWSYQKIFFPSYFDTEINKLLKIAKYIPIPIGIETSSGSHANILFWDVKNKTIERFEPNGSNYPIGLNYNPNLLDDLLYNKFIQFDKDIKYYSPPNFLPTIGFQMLEGLETPKCKKIGDPNGFCAVWCIWWVYTRMLNINLELTNIADEFIKRIKFDNQSFKNIIRNFSKKITFKRDNFLQKYKLDINDWVLGNYTDEILNKIEKDIFDLIL
jgi:ankyrin repeat protein